MEILSGKVVADKLTNNLKERVAKLKAAPLLIIFHVGFLPASTKYIQSKQKKAEEIGIKVETIHFPETITEKELIIQILANVDRATGAIVQLPLPIYINKHKVLNAIPFEKDVDGLAKGNTLVTPATPKGIMTLLKYYGHDATGKIVGVVGQSNLVGLPTAILFEKSGAASVSRFNRKTGIVGSELADILIVAAGEPKLIKKDNVKMGAVVIDVGINEIADDNAMKKIVGDVDHEDVANKVKAISPVPGGVGPMTVISLMENVVEAAERAEAFVPEEY